MSGKNSFLKGIFAFLTAFFLFGAILFWVFFAISFPTTVLDAVQKSGYAKKAALEAEEKINFIAQVGGFGDGFFDGTVTAENVEENLVPFIISSFKGESFTADETRLKEKISDKVFKAAEEKMSGYSAETREMLEQTVDLCAKEAVSTCVPGLIGYLSRFFGRFKDVFFVAATVLSALLLSCVFKLKKQSFRLFKTSLISASLMLGTVPALIMLFAKFQNLGIDSLALKDFLSCFIFGVLTSLVILAVIILSSALFLRKKDPVSN